MKNLCELKLLCILFVLYLPFVGVIMSSSSSFPIENAYAAAEVEEDTSSASSSCITYDPSTQLITITCSSANLSDIYKQLNDVNILQKESGSGTAAASNNNNNSNVWLLNAGLVIEKGATFYINSTDTSWLKIVADGRTVYPIQVFGSLKIDSVKVTSWNPTTNDYGITPDSERHGTETHVGTPRPYIRVEESNGTAGTTDITNSEIAYLGYEGGLGAGRTGLSYTGGDGSIIKVNDIHHLWFGFYSSGVGGMIIENNHVHHNGEYGLDPHTGTHDMIIRNNTVHDNPAIGIICSLNCYHITIENNKVYSNGKHAVMFSRNMYDSIARSNIISNATVCISVSESHNNEVYNNRVSFCNIGVALSGNSSNNVIHDNTIANSIAAISTDGAGTGNNLYSNKAMNANHNGIL